MRAGPVRTAVMSWNLLVHALVTIVIAVMMFGFPALAFVVVRYFKLKERELAFEVEYRLKSEQQQVALEQRMQRLEDAMTSSERGMSVRPGIDQPPAPPGAHPRPTS